MRVPAAVQALALALALLAFLLDTLTGIHLLTEGDPIGASGHLVVGGAFLLLFTWVVAAPRRARERLERWFGLDLEQPAHVVAALVQVAFIYLVFGLTIVATTRGLSEYLATGENPAGSGELTADLILNGLLINLVLFVVASSSWLFLVDGSRGRAMLRDLGLQLERFPRGFAWGLAATIAVLAGVASLGYALQVLGLDTDNPQADAIALALTPTLAVLVALMAGLGEEIYFRGFLHPRTGNVVQATLFGAIHATYLTPLQVILPFLLGLFYGWLRDRVGLWAPIVSHASYNAFVLYVAIAAEEMGGGLAALLT